MHAKCYRVRRSVSIVVTAILVVGMQKSVFKFTVVLRETDVRRDE